MSEQDNRSNKVPAIELRGITKTFGRVVANEDVNLTVERGEILAILGENGSGKTTLMNMIAGIYFPDQGQIFVNGEEVSIGSPRDAFAHGIGMIHQHFKLVDLFTATENVVLGLKDEKRFNIREYAERVRAISEQYGFELDPYKKIYNMSVSEKQTVEIIKVLYRGADILILDEPTAVLTPQETEKLFAVLRRMRDAGKSIIIITHKLHEVLSISQRVAVLCRGRYVGTVLTKDTDANKLTEMMVGKKVSLDIRRSEVKATVDRLIVDNLNLINREGLPVLRNVSFTAKGGEILGIAGIAGSGQRELLEAIAGLQRVHEGTISYNNPKDGKIVNLVGMNPMQIRELGVRLSFVPEDRLGMGLVGNMDIVDNMMLRSYTKGSGMMLQREDPRNLADTIIHDLEVVTPGASTPVRRLSGGNVQKVLVGREIASAPAVLMAAYPVRGLDINSSFTIYNLLNEQKERGTAVIFVGEDLDVLLELCDRILVISSGSVAGIVDAKTTTKEAIGLAMTQGAHDAYGKVAGASLNDEQVSEAAAGAVVAAAEGFAQAGETAVEGASKAGETAAAEIVAKAGETAAAEGVAKAGETAAAEIVAGVGEVAQSVGSSAKDAVSKVGETAAAETVAKTGETAAAVKDGAGKNKKRVKDPLFHIVKRDALPWYKSWLIRIAAVLGGILVGSIISLMLGIMPLELYDSIWDGAMGTSNLRWSLGMETVLLLGIAVALTPAFKMRFWNIGAEGQVLIGGLASAMCMLSIGTAVPSWLLIIIMLVASIAAGAIWAFLPAFFKAFWNTNETLFTLMMNYIAMQIVAYYVLVNSSPPGSAQIGMINQDTQAGWLPSIFGQPYLLSIVIVLVLTGVMYIYLRYFKHGYELTVVGESENTARYIGVNVKKVVIRTMILSGAICGLIGFLIVGARDRSIATDTVQNRGFTAIMVSWLAHFNPLYMILTAFLIAFMGKGAMEVSTRFPELDKSFSDILIGILIFFIIGSEFFVNYRIMFRKKRKEEER